MPKASKFNMESATYDQTREWAKQQLARGVSRQDLRAVADEQDRRRNGNWSVVDGIRHVIG